MVVKKRPKKYKRKVSQDPRGIRLNENITMNSSTISIRKYRVIVFFLCVAVFVPILYMSYTFYHDDAYITLRYAHNFIHGDGIVWNKGEYVQGYTNFLHLLLISLLGFFGCDLWLASRIISVIAFFILTSWSVVFPILFGKRNGAHPMDMISFFIISTSAPMLVWILGGLEGVLFSTLSSLGVMTLVYATRLNNNARLILLSGLFFSPAGRIDNC